MKALILYYSRSGKTRNIAEIIGKKLAAEVEEIIDHKSRKGLLGFIASGNEAYLQRVIPIEKIEKDLSQYNVVVVGTPIWAGNMSTPILSFFREYKEKIPRIAFFTTSIGSDPQKIFLTVEHITAQKLVAVLNFTNRDIKKRYHLEMIDEFINIIKQALKD